MIKVEFHLFISICYKCLTWTATPITKYTIFTSRRTLNAELNSGYRDFIFLGTTAYILCDDNSPARLITRGCFVQRKPHKSLDMRFFRSPESLICNGLWVHVVSGAKVHGRSKYLGSCRPDSNELKQRINSP